LNAGRAGNLRSQGFNVTQDDAMEVMAPRADRIIANPPFGAVRSGGESTVYEIGDYRTTRTTRLLAQDAVRLNEGGRAC